MLQFCREDMMGEEDQPNGDATTQSACPADKSQHEKIETLEHLLEYFRILVDWDQKAKEAGP
jgi:hypothetical protein